MIKPRVLFSAILEKRELPKYKPRLTVQNPGCGCPTSREQAVPQHTPHPDLVLDFIIK